MASGSDDRQQPEADAGNGQRQSAAVALIFRSSFRGVNRATFKTIGQRHGHDQGDSRRRQQVVVLPVQAGQNDLQAQRRSSSAATRRRPTVVPRQHADRPARESPPARGASFQFPTRPDNSSSRKARGACLMGSALPVSQRTSAEGAPGSGKVSVASARPYCMMSS